MIIIHSLLPHYQFTHKNHYILFFHIFQQLNNFFNVFLSTDFPNEILIFYFHKLYNNVIINVTVPKAYYTFRGVKFMYKDNYGFFYKIKQTVYKWWCVVYKPVYKLTHNGYWPQEKEPYYNPEADQKKEQQKLLAEQMANQVSNSIQNTVDNIITNTEDVTNPITKDSNSDPVNNSNTDSDINPNTNQDIDSDALARANEIMERLMREAAEDEAKKQAQIDEAKRTADEQARLAAIMKANQVDISQYIEQGKANQNKTQEETL